MTSLQHVARSSALVVCAFTASSGLRAADAVRPLHAIQVVGAEMWIGEGAGQGTPTWIVGHAYGLKRIDVASGEAVDVLKTDRREISSGRGRSISANGKVYAFPSAPGVMTFRRVEDGTTFAHADAVELFGRRSLPSLTYLSHDGSYCICLCHSSRRQTRLVRVEISPSPRVVASHDLGRLAHDLNTEAGQFGWGVVTTSELNHRGARFFQVFDSELHLEHKQQIQGAWMVCALRSGPADDSRTALLADTEHNRWELVRRDDRDWTTLCAGLHPARPGFRGIHAAAISPDGKWVVTSPESPQPTLGIWSVPEGALKREIRLEGGLHALPSDPTIHRIDFSASGEFLSASDAKNAYLLRFRELVDEQPSSRR